MGSRVACSVQGGPARGAFRAQGVAEKRSVRICEFSSVHFILVAVMNESYCTASVSSSTRQWMDGESCAFRYDYSWRIIIQRCKIGKNDNST